MVAERAERPAPASVNLIDSTEFSLGLPPTGLQYMLNGGLEVEYGVRMRPGDVITSVTRLDGYSEREGRLGLMLFTTTEQSWSNQSGDLIKRTRMTLIRY